MSPDAASIEVTFEDHWSIGGAEDRGTPGLRPVVLRQGRAARRLSVAQIEASIVTLFDGITWDNGAATNPRVMFELLARTLGVPDYLQLTGEDLSATPLFAKFMDDMAGQVCRKAVEHDAAESNVARRVLVPYPADVDRTLRFIRLKLHAIYVPDGSTESIAELRRLYDEILADTVDSTQAWIGVCVAALTAPEMMTY